MKYILDYEQYTKTARQAVADGQVLLENNNNVLPIVSGSTVSVFGRMQFHYYKSGTGSGGMVNVNRVIGIYDALKECENDTGVIKVYEPLADVYRKWEETNPVEEGVGWGTEPWFQKEMPLTEDVVKDAASNSDYAIAIIARVAGEDRDNHSGEGSYLLTENEIAMLKAVRKSFEKMIVVLNVGNIIDMSFVEDIKPDSVLYAWQGGMIGGLGTVDVLTGVVNPSGRLTDTIAKNVEDYPSDANFGDPDVDIYAEDVFVGYRYFETFAKDKVLYPFGFGLSYTDFDISTDSVTKARDYVSVSVTVTNVGLLPGKEVVQVYVEAPCGKLSKPKRVLAGFKKTGVLTPGGSANLVIDVPFSNFASFDDANVCGLGTGFVIEAGEYSFCIGKDVRKASVKGSVCFEENTLLEALENALGPVQAFDRMIRNDDDTVGYEAAPLRKDTVKERRDNRLPADLDITGDKGYKLQDVKDGKVTLDNFVAQLSKEELCTIIRGEGMSSKQVTAGTAAAFGGISPALKDKGIPVGCMDDGPSGMRLDSGMKAFSLPNGTLLASTFDVELNEKLFGFLGIEMVKNKVDVLLGPGMNIHRHPLNGRNFEYFSEDPLLTGLIGSAQIIGLQKSNVTGTIKHFACNNQETGRKFMDPVVSERALREIYLKGFEIAVKNGADSVMTTYCKINNEWTGGSYDLNTTILREQWGFKGIVMTDWWAYLSGTGRDGSLTDFAAMVRSQNDLYCCVPGATTDIGDNAYPSLEDGSLTLGELQRTAKNVCRFFLNKTVFQRLTEDIEVEVTGAEEGFGEDLPEIIYNLIDESDVGEIDFTGQVMPKGKNVYFGVEAPHKGSYKVTLEGCGVKGNDLAQLPVVLFCNSTPCCNFVFRGTGEWSVQEDTIYFYTPRNICYMFLTLGGVDLKKLRFEWIGDD